MDYGMRALLRGILDEVFADAGAHVGLGARTELEGAPEQMRAHGYLELHTRRALAERALAEVVAPAAASVLRGAPPPMRAHTLA